MKKIPSLSDAEKYLEYKYVDGEFDCGSLAVLVQRELFDREIDIPHASDRARGARGQASDLAKYQKSLAELVATPATGDAVVMWTTTENGAPPFNRRWHIGTAFVQNNEVWVLHCANEKRGVAIQRLSQIESNGVHVDAFYTWTKPKRIQVTVRPRPLSQEILIHSVPFGTTLEDALRGLGIVGPNWTVKLNGATVPYAMWPHTRVRYGVGIDARARHKKQILQIVAMLVLTWFTFGAGSLFIGAGAAIGGGFIAAAAVFVGGSMLITKLLGPKPASMGSIDNMQAPPTYSLGAPRNRARLFEPIALVLGETKMVPDNANQPFQYFFGEDMHITAQFHAGINCDSISAMKIGANPVTNYEEVTIRRYGFSANNDPTPPSVGSSVDTIEGGLIDWPHENAEPTQLIRVTSPGTVRVELDLEGTVQNMSSKGKWVNKLLDITMQYRPYGTPGNGGWLPLGTGIYHISNMGPKPVRKTLPFNFPSGRWEIMLTKGEKNSTQEGGQERMQNDIALVRLKSFQEDLADYGGQARIELDIKASGQINGNLDEVNWIARAKPLPYWTGTEWIMASEPGANGISNPGAIILMLLRGIYRPSDGKRIAGVGFTDSRIDIESLKGFMVRCALKGYRFDFVVQESMNAQTLLETVASAGLATITRQNNGRIGVVWFAEDQPIEGVINMAAMRTGEAEGVEKTVVSNFTVQYDLVRTADEFQLEFFDRDNEWTWQPMRVIAPGVDVPQRTSTENVRGVTTMAHAATLARFSMAQNLYGRKTISFELDLDYLDYKRGAVVALSHDLTQWGYGGRLYAFSKTANSFTLTFDDPVPTGGLTIGLRLPGERQMRTFPVGSVGADGLTVVVNQAWPVGVNNPGVQAPVHDTLWIYDFKSTPGYRVRIMSIEPGSDSKSANVMCVPESPEFWNYVETGEFIPPPNNSSLVVDLPVASKLKVTRGRILQSGSWVHQLTAGFDVRGAYDHAQLWAAPVGNPLQPIDTQVFGTQVSWIVPSDQTWSVEIRPFDALGRMGTKVATVYADPADAVAGVVALAVSFESTGVFVRWATPSGVAAVGWSLTQVKLGGVGGTWETASIVFEGKTDHCNLGWLSASNYLVWAAHLNDAGDMSVPIAVPLNVTVPGQPTVEGNAWGLQVELEWTAVASVQPLRGYEVRVGPIYAESVLRTELAALNYVYSTEAAGEYRHWVTAIDLGGNRSAPGSALVTTTPGITEGIEELQQGLDAVIQDIIDLGQQIEQETADRGTAITEVERLITEGDEQLAEQIEIISARSSGYVRGNMLRNGGFERGMDAWTVIAGATFTSYDSEYGRIAQSNVHAATGFLYSDEFIGRDNLWYTAAIDVELQTAGAEWQIGIWFYGADHSAIDAPLDVWRPSVGFVASTFEYRQTIAFERQAPVGTRFIRFILYWRGMNSSPILLRAAKVEQGRLPATSYITGAADVGTLAAVSVVSQATADVTGKVNASWTLAVTAGGKIGGVKFMANGVESIAAFLFDRITFAINDADANPKQLLTLGLVAGAPSVGVAGNMFIDGYLAARMIQADAIRAVHIKSDEIEVRHLKAGSVTAVAMAIGVSGNLLPNSTIITTAGWGPGDDILGGTFAGRNLNANYTPAGENCLQIYQPSAGNAGGYSYWISDFFAVDPLTRYEFSVLIGAYGCTAQAYMEVYDAGITTWLGGTPLATNAREKIGGKSLGEFKLLFGFLNVPGNAAVGRLVIRKNHTEVGPDSLLTITRPMVAKATSAQTVPSMYSATGQGTLITAAGITTPSLEALSANVGLLRTASSGGRMEIYSNVIKSFDDSNVLRAKFGNLNL